MRKALFWYSNLNVFLPKTKTKNQKEKEKVLLDERDHRGVHNKLAGLLWFLAEFVSHGVRVHM